MPLGMEVGLGPGHIVLDGDPDPLLKKGAGPLMFGPSLLWSNGCRMHQDATWYGVRPQPRRLCLRDSAFSYSKMGRSTQFSTHVYCGQTAGWIRIPLGTEVSFGLRDIVLDGDRVPPSLKGHSPHFSANVRRGQKTA